MFPVLLRFSWLLIQAFTAFSLIIPAVLCLFYFARRRAQTQPAGDEELHEEKDYAIIVPAYESSETLYALLQSLTELDYSNYLVYVAGNRFSTADACLHNEKLVYLRITKDYQPRFLHRFVIENFRRPHTHVAILSPDSLVEKDYLTCLNTFFNQGYQAVTSRQYQRCNKGAGNLIQHVICHYRHFFADKLMFSAGASATLGYSGTAFTISSYKPYLKTTGETTGFTPVVQTKLAGRNRRIAFAEEAVVYRYSPVSLQQLAGQHAQRVHDWIMCLPVWCKTMMKGLWQREANLLLTGLFSLRLPLPTAVLLALACLAVNTRIYMAMSWFWAGMLLLAGVYMMAAAMQWKKQNLKPGTVMENEEETDESIALYEPEESYEVIMQTI